MNRPALHPRAFTLVEVALALGIAAFALVPIIGLLAIGMNTNADAGSDTSIAAMTTYVLNDLRSAPFNAIGEAVPTATANYTKTPLNTTLADSTYYFSRDGSWIDPATISAPGVQVVYECVVRKTADVSTQTTAGGTEQPYNQIRLQLYFSWPYVVTDRAQRPNKRSIYASVARY